MAGEVEVLALHVVLNGVVERKLCWFNERGVSLRNPAIVERDISELLQYLEKEQITSIPQDELKAAWCAFEKDAVLEVKALAQGGADLDGRGKSGRTPLHLAVELQNTEVLMQLLDQDASVNAVDRNGRTPLHLAVEFGRTKMVPVLLDRGANVNAVDKVKMTVLHYSAFYGRTEVIPIFLNRDADVNAIDRDGMTAIHLAVEIGSADVMTLLLVRDAEVNAVDNYGRTPLLRAMELGRTKLVPFLLDRDADVNAVGKDRRTALHLAITGTMTDMVALLLDRGAFVDGVDTGYHTPLSILIWSYLGMVLKDKVEVARLLCSRGANPNLVTSVDTTWRVRHQMGLLACTHHWYQCHEHGKPLTEIPTEVIEGGEDAVKTFLIDLEKTRSDQLLYRCKVCIVGPSKWGKTSLVKSIIMNEQWLVDVEDRTIGIDLFPFTFDETNNAGTTSTVKRHDVTFWDFAGQDVYHVTHALFYSERTLYLICVDLGEYATKLDEVKACSRTEKDAILQRFFEENMLRWVRSILYRQPSAQFKVIGTKDDLAFGGNILEDILDDMNCRMNSFVDNLDKDGVKDEVKSALDAEFRSSNLVTTSAGRVESIKLARKSIEQAIIAKPDISFMMPATYSQVLEYIFKIKRASESATPEDRVEQVIMTFSELFKKLKRDIPDLVDAGECREILRVLHKLGDILWYEDETTREYELIILDPKLMLDLVREVVNHNYEGQNGESYEALRRDGILHHTLLMSFSWWKALKAVDDQMVHLFKHLLQYFDLAYPANNVDELDEVDMIVPTYWKTRAAAQEIVISLSKQPSILTRNDVVGSVIATWQYSLPVDISEAVYVNFVVRCYRQNVVRKIGATFVECLVRGEFGAVINFDANETERWDDIMIEVAAATTEIAWAEMRDFVMAMERVLLNYPGLKPTKQKRLKRYIVDPSGKRVVLNGLMDNPDKETRLRSIMSRLPPDFDWFLQRAWENPEKLEQLQAQKIILQLPHRLEVLKQLAVSGEARPFPALWTLSYSNEAEAPVIELRIHSDLSGVCYHAPLRITVPRYFIMRHADLIQNGISVLSAVSSLIPFDIASTAVEAALPASQTALNHAQTVNSVLAKAGLSRGEVKSVTELDMPVQSRMAFLRDLLRLDDPTFNDSKIGEVSNLCCAADNSTGCYVWVHARELEEMKGHLTPCHSPNPPSMIPSSTSTSISIRVTRLLCTGRVKSGKKIYCEWEIIHHTRRVAIGKTEEIVDSGADITWASSPVQLTDVSSITMLQESTMTVFVKQPHRFAKFFDGKEIGHGEMRLKDHVGVDFSISSPVEIEIALEGKKIPPHSTVICEISIVSAASSCP